MLRKLSTSVKRNILVAVTALVVAYVRRAIQYHRYSWDSIGQFLTYWLIHFISVSLLIGVSYIFIKMTEKFFFEDDRQSNSITVEEAIFYVTMVVLVAAILIFFFAHWIPIEDDIYE